MKPSPFRRLLLGAAAWAALGALPGAGSQLPRPFEFSQVRMGLPVRILLYAPNQRRAENAAEAAFERMAALDATLRGDDSELRRLEASGTAWTPVSPDVLELLTAAEAVARATRGAYDPTSGPVAALWQDARAKGALPDEGAIAAARESVGWAHLEIDRARGAVRLAKPGMRLDLGTMARGYMLQEGLQAIRGAGLGRASLESGGDIVVGSGPPGLAGWRVETPDASADFRDRASELTNAALATASTREPAVEIGGTRRSHAVDPRTGIGVTKGVTARVIARDAALASALAAALSISGPEGVQAVLEAYPDVLISLAVGGQR